MVMYKIFSFKFNREIFFIGIIQIQIIQKIQNWPVCQLLKALKRLIACFVYFRETGTLIKNFSRGGGGL